MIFKKKINVAFLFFTILTLIVVIVCIDKSLNVHAQSLVDNKVVCPSGVAGQNGCDYIGADGIQQAIDAIADGTADLPSVITLQTGQYNSVDVSIGGTHPVKNYITIISSGQVNIIRKFDSTSAFTVDSSKGIVFSNLTVVAPTTLGQTIIFNNQSDGVVKNSILKGGKTTVSALNNSNVQFLNNNIGLDSLIGVGANIILVNSSALIQGNHLQYANNCINISNTTEEVKIYGNSIKNCTSGITLSGGGNNEVKNNIFANNQQGFWLLKEGTNNNSIEVINNTFVDNTGADFLLPGQANWYNSLYVKHVVNNIFASTSNSKAANYYPIYSSITSYPPDAISFNYNLFYIYPNGLSNINITLGINNIMNQDPKFVFSLNPDYTLQPGSPGINAGDPSILDPDGSRSDIGAYGGQSACLLNNKLAGCTNVVSPSPTITPFPSTCKCNSDNTCDSSCPFTKRSDFSYSDPVFCQREALGSYPTPSQNDKDRFCQSIKRTLGDSDNNGIVDNTDYFYYVAAVNGGGIPTSVNPDFNGDGVISVTDRSIILATLTQVLTATKVPLPTN